jgi:hypothetical protein
MTGPGPNVNGHQKTSKFDHWPAVIVGGLGGANADVPVNAGTD